MKLETAKSIFGNLTSDTIPGISLSICPLSNGNYVGIVVVFLGQDRLDFHIILKTLERELNKEIITSIYKGLMADQPFILKSYIDKLLKENL